MSQLSTNPPNYRDSLDLNSSEAQLADEMLLLAIKESKDTYHREQLAREQGIPPSLVVHQHSRNSVIDQTIGRRRQLRVSTPSPNHQVQELPAPETSSTSWSTIPTPKQQRRPEISSGTIATINALELVLLNYDSGHCAPVGTTICEDDKYLWSGADDHTIRLWDLQNNIELATIAPRLGEIHDLEFDKHFVYAACGHQSFLVLNKKDLSISKVVHNHTHRVWCLAQSKDLLFSGSWDGSVNVHSKTGFKLLHSLQNLGGPVNALHCDGKYLYIGAGNFLYQYPLSKHFAPESQNKYEKHTDRITGITSDSKYVYTVSMDKTLQIYKRSSKLFHYHTIADHTNPILCIAANDNLVFTGSLSGQTRVWNSKKKWKCEAIIKGRISSVWSLSLGSKHLFLGASDKKIRIISIKDFSRSAVFNGRTDFLSDCISDRLTIFGASSQRGTIFAWHKQLPVGFPKTLSGHKDFVRTLAVDDKYLYSGGLDKRLYVWNKSTLKPVKILVGHKEPIRRVFVNGNVVFTCDFSGVIGVWLRDRDFKLVERLVRPFEEVEKFSKREPPQKNWVILGLTSILATAYSKEELALIEKNRKNSLLQNGIILRDTKVPKAMVAFHPNLFSKNAAPPSSILKIATLTRNRLLSRHKAAIGG